MVIELTKYEGTDDSLEDEEESSQGRGIQHSHLQTAVHFPIIASAK